MCPSARRRRAQRRRGPTPPDPPRRRHLRNTRSARPLSAGSRCLSRRCASARKGRIAGAASAADLAPPSACTPHSAAAADCPARSLVPLVLEESHASAAKCSRRPWGRFRPRAAARARAGRRGANWQRQHGGDGGGVKDGPRDVRHRLEHWSVAQSVAQSAIRVGRGGRPDTRNSRFPAGFSKHRYRDSNPGFRTENPSRFVTPR
jgi:hypothetical protein